MAGECGFVHRGDAGGAEKCFAEKRRYVETGVVVADFAEIGEGVFGHDGFDARIDGGGLEGIGSAHGDAEHGEVRDFF